MAVFHGALDAMFGIDTVYAPAGRAGVGAGDRPDAIVDFGETHPYGDGDL